MGTHNADEGLFKLDGKITQKTAFEKLTGRPDQVVSVEFHGVVFNAEETPDGYAVAVQQLAAKP